MSSDDSSEEESGSESDSESDDDPKDKDYRAPRNSKAKLSSNSSSATRLLRRRLDHVSNGTSPLTVTGKIPATTGPTDGRPGRVAFLSSTSTKPNTSNPTSEPKLPVFPIRDQVTGSLSPVTALATTSSESPATTTATATQPKITLFSGAEALSPSECRESGSTPSNFEPVAATLLPLPALPSSQDGVPMTDNLSNADSQNNLAALAPNHSPSRGTVADQLTQPQNVLESNGRVLQGEIIPNLFPEAEVEMNGGAPFTADVVGPDRSVDRDATFDLPKSSPSMEPSTSAMDTETSPLSGGVRPGGFGLTSSSVSEQNDHMDVDEPVPTTDRVEDLHGMVASLLSDPREIKVRRAMLLLRGLLRDQQIWSGSIRTMVDGGEDTFIPARHSLPSDTLYPFVDGEEPFIMEEHLELVAKCSSLLSKYLMGYKGRELEERMTELDERLQVQQELSNTGTVRNLATESDVRAGSHLPVCADKEVATVVDEDHSELVNQGQGIVGDEQVEKLAGIMQDPATDTVTRQSLTPEAMVNLSSVPLTTASTDSDLKIELLSWTALPATRLVTFMVRNLADLLDCIRHGGGDSDDAKSKERALDMAGPTTIGTPYDLLLVSPLLNEFKSMKEELRKSQQRTKEEIESIARLHSAELVSLKEHMRAIEKCRGETESLMQQHREEMDSLMGSVRGAKKQATVEAEGKLPLLELQQRITTLESHTRSLSYSPSQAGPFSRPVCEDESDSTSFRRPPFHPLGHLFDYEGDAVSPVPYRWGTSIQSELSNAALINSIPLPIKSQRKLQFMH